jgi:two-component system response regulator MprA
MKRRILLVEDDPEISRIVNLVLLDEAYEVETAADGAQALEILRRGGERPHAILLDLMLPGMDAWKFRELQKAEPRIAAIPIVVFSAHAKIAEHAAELGAISYVRKPPDLEELLSALERATSSAR